MDSLAEETSWNFDPKASFDATLSTAISSDLHQRVFSLELEVLSLRAQLNAEKETAATLRAEHSATVVTALPLPPPHILLNAPVVTSAMSESSRCGTLFVVSRGTQTNQVSLAAAGAQTDISSSGSSNVTRSSASRTASDELAIISPCGVPLGVGGMTVRSLNVSTSSTSSSPPVDRGTEQPTRISSVSSSLRARGT